MGLQKSIQRTATKFMVLWTVSQTVRTENNVGTVSQTVRTEDDVGTVSQAVRSEISLYVKNRCQVQIFFTPGDRCLTPILFVAEAVDGVGGGGFDGLVAYGQHSDAQSENTREQKHPGFDRCAVGKILEPGLRQQPG